MNNPAWLSLPPLPDLGVPDRELRTPSGDALIWSAEFGSGCGGVPVLLLHGGFASSNYFAHLIPRLVDAGHRVIVIDSRGHGRSSLGTVGLSYALMAQDVLTVLAAHEVDQADLIGWSDGGCIGYELAIRGARQVRRLLAVAANIDHSSIPGGSAEEATARPAFAQYLARINDEHQSLALPDQGFDAFFAAMDAMWAVEPHYSVEALGRIAVPTMLALGQHDEVVSLPHLFGISQAIPDVSLITMPGVSHFSMLQNPDLFADVAFFFLRNR